ncbi:MAG TPA: zinc ribbon domain-containing protein [Terriglobales bacterium]|nr:zinc ribbon domain-containing protein [Terriglobales bacterium]
MAFCTSCGANIPDAAGFCTSCGKKVEGAVPVAAAPATTAPGDAPSKSGSGLKIVLIVLGVFFVIGMVVVGAVSYGAYRIAQQARIETSGAETRVETPFGTVETHQDVEKAEESLGVAIYPGATAKPGGSSSVEFGGMKVASGVFETDDDPEKVMEFYKEEFPKARIMAQDGDTQSLMADTKDGFITVAIARQDSKTVITIARTEK